MPYLRSGFSDTPSHTPFVSHYISINNLMTVKISFLLFFKANKLSRAADTPQPRPALFNMPTPETPYGRLLNVIFCAVVQVIQNNTSLKICRRIHHRIPEKCGNMRLTIEFA